MNRATDDIRIQALNELVPPVKLIKEFPLSDAGVNTVRQARQGISNILAGRDDRLAVIVGPCSIHDVDAAMEYAVLLKKQMALHQHELLIVMRVYFEKPRTSIGWKGLINDPHLDNSFDINHGLRTARKLLVDIADMGLPAAVEFLDTITPQFIGDTISWGAIGARTTESQIHRELSSGLSMPIGFKNSTDGNVNNALDAIIAAKNPHHFLSVTKEGNVAIVSTVGNPDGHVVLRGSEKGTNYDDKSIVKTVKALTRLRLESKVMIDCSHGNSQKDHTRQHLVSQSVAQQIAAGSRLVMGLMIESHLKAGKQAFIVGQSLEYGKSITDACVSFDETVVMLQELAEAVKARRKIESDTDALSQIRIRIDEIDKAIENLITERAKQAMNVAKVKKSDKGNAILYRPEREQLIINRVIERNEGPVSDAQMEDIFRQIMTACLEVEK